MSGLLLERKDDMYKYELLNNHYVVNIGDDKFLIDTGRPDSFVFEDRPRDIEINGKPFTFGSNTMDEEATRVTMELVGTQLTGFIGARILFQTGLTIYKNGELYFENKAVAGGHTLPFVGGPIIEAVVNGVRGRFFIDTGAKYGYTERRLIPSGEPIERNVHDFSPMREIRHMHSDIYNINVEIDGMHKTVPAGYNQKTINRPVGMGEILLIGNITTLFDEVCVIDFGNRRLILK